MQKLISVIILFLCFNLSNAQNLVLNGNFEEFTKCPKGLKPQEKPTVLKYVTNPNEGSFDFIHTCDNSNYPRYYWGEESPQDGEGYTGICVFKNSSNYDEGEYLQLQIKDSLKKGKVYHFEMYLSLGDKSHITINKLGIYFSNYLQQLKSKKCLFKPDIISYDYFENKIGWAKYTGDYIAKGGEKYIIIGNFYSSKKTTTKVIDVGFQINDTYVYYFIDNVSLTVNNNLANGIILNNVNFKSGSKDLIKSSFGELDKIVSVLITNPKYYIEIIGHTDNKGNDFDNLKLSQDRAQTVAEYLIEKGISKSRIKSSGKGSKHAIGNNETNAGRLKNRRVEFIFKQ